LPLACLACLGALGLYLLFRGGFRLLRSLAITQGQPCSVPQLQAARLRRGCFRSAAGFRSPSRSLPVCQAVWHIRTSVRNKCFEQIFEAFFWVFLAICQNFQPNLTEFLNRIFKFFNRILTESKAFALCQSNRIRTES
jgi:hypothetical protein